MRDEEEAIAREEKNKRRQDFLKNKLEKHKAEQKLKKVEEVKVRKETLLKQK